MLSKHPDPEHDEPATSPALARRRDHMLRNDAMRHIEPRLIPSADDEQPSFLPQHEFDGAEDEPDPDIPPHPAEAMRAANDHGLERSGRSPRRPKLWPMAAAAVSVIALGAGAWLIYDRMMAEPSGGEVPYVTADAGPEKIRPQQEGGMEVPNQDIRVYNELDRSPPAKESEVLLPAAEAPVTPPDAADAKSQTAPEAAGVPSVPAPTLDVAPAAGATTRPEDAAAPAADAKAAGAAPPDQAIQTATTVGAFRIQLAAVKTREAAQVVWKKMTKSYPDVLEGLALNVVKVDRGADGTLFRVQGGPFANREAAESACGTLKQKSQACLVVAP
jgi:cell division septation protein DedD